jgi:hypothetical protein
MLLGEQIAQRYLTFNDRLIGIIGGAGSGKSSFIKGMFPGLDLVNDDDGLNPHKVMQMQIQDHFDSISDTTTFHLDMRFQTAFTQMHEIVSFVKNALKSGRRVIIEHFELLYPALEMNAEIMIGIGEEIIVTRPYVFGPFPKDIANIVHASLKYRKMAHTAEEVVMMILRKEYDIGRIWKSSDIKKGFILVFDEKPKIDLVELEKKARNIIDFHLDVAYYDEGHIKIGDHEPVPCSGPRIHIKNTAEIENFRLFHDFTYDSLNNTYLLVGLIGSGDYGNEGFNKPHVF